MTTEVVARIKLIADDGNILTDGKVYGRVVFLSEQDKPENWREISEEEFYRTTVKH